jgi:acyl-CoA synthetase (AMP-forming)/AMP-acid ligase II
MIVATSSKDRCALARQFMRSPAIAGAALFACPDERSGTRGLLFMQAKSDTLKAQKIKHENKHQKKTM